MKKLLAHSRWFLVGVFFLLMACNQPVDTTPSISDEEAEQIMNDFFTSLSEADTTLLNNITTDDFYLFEHDVIWNADSLLNLMSRTQGRVWVIKDFKVVKDGDIAHFNYFNESANPVGRSWLESGVLVREEGDVKIKFLHSTKLYLNQ